MLKPEQILNDTYKIIEQIGSGGGGIIYKAYHLRMRKYVAIKLIKNDINGKINNRSEVDVLKNLKNDYLPQVIDFVEDGEDVYTVMEYIDGLNFRQLIERGRHFTEKQVKKYALQLCDAVEYLHNHVPPIIHSDIKPANVMLTPQDNICLIDFNISMMIGNGKAVSIGGSQGFAAPEQFKKYIEVPVTIDDFHEETRFVDEDETEILIDETSHPIITSSHVKTKNMARAFIDIRTDIYGIGATIYYMLTERVPQNGKLDFRGINCSAKIREVIEKAMAPDPAKRYKNVAEMKRAIISKKNIEPTLKIASILLSVIIAVGMLVLLVVINMYKKAKADVIENETSVSETKNHTSITSEGTTINKNSITEGEDSEEEFIQTQELDINKFNQSLLNHINEERSFMQIYPLKEDTELHKIATSLAQDISNKTYTKGTGKTYFKNKYDYCDLYYEDVFDISLYDNEDEIASALLKYEKDNFSYLWLDEKFQYFSSNVSVNSDGTWCIVFCLAGDKTITINDEKYSRDLIELDLSDKGLASEDIVDIPYMYNLEILKLDNNHIPDSDVFKKLPKLKKLWLDNNGITTLSFLEDCNNLEVLTLNKNNISDITPLINLKNLDGLYLYANNIQDISILSKFNRLNKLDLRKNSINKEDITKLQETLPNCEISY